MGLGHSPAIVSEGLVFYFDPINTRSYAGTGLTGFNLIDTSINGSFLNGPVYDTANKGSIYFDGVDDYIDFGSSTIFKLLDNFTLSTWVKSSVYGDRAILGNFGPSTDYSGFNLNIQPSNKFAFLTGSAATATYLYSNDTFALNTWYHLTAVRQNGTNYLYVNGVVQSSTNTQVVKYSNQNFYFAKWYSNLTGFYHNGQIASASFYNRALSSTEVLQNYNATKKRFSPEENIVLDGLILEFDAGNSSSYSGIGNTGYTVAGAGVTASLINGTSFSTLNGGSFVFDGSNDHIILNDFYLTQTNSSNEYTIMASGKLATISTGVRQLVSSDSGGYDWSFGAAGTGYFIFTGAGSTSASTQDLNWHIFAAQWSSAGSRLYLDNSLLINTTVAYDAGINQTFIGKNPTVGFGEYWNGNVGTVLIYNRILTTQELTQNYNALKGRYGLS